MSKYILAIDQGTTSTRSIIFDQNLEISARAQEEFKQYFPDSGWVEHNAEEIWASTISTINIAISNAAINAKDIAAIGITNQRETTLVWDKSTGQPVFNAIVWQDRRTSAYCEELSKAGWEEKINDITGLVIDPYFSATKLKWILDHVDGAREKARKGELAFGTIDSFLIWRLTNGRAHVTDATNAARTMLYDIHKGEWSEEICALMDIPLNMLPEVKDCAAPFGDAEILGQSVPILGVAGDQQAATIGQACFQPGMIKSTYGTGCFAVLNTGKKAVKSQNRLLTTIAYRLNGEVAYALEGSIFIAGAVVQWLRDSMKIIDNAKETESLAEAADAHQNIIIVPAFTGLGAPYWKPETRGAIFGLTRGTSPKELTRAALQSVGFQTHDLISAMNADWGQPESMELRVDGGMSANAFAMQFLSDILNQPVIAPQNLETTILGAAWLAGHQAGLYPNQSEFAQKWQAAHHYAPKMENDARQAQIQAWQRAINATIAFSK